MTTHSTDALWHGASTEVVFSPGSNDIGSLLVSEGEVWADLERLPVQVRREQTSLRLLSNSIFAMEHVESRERAMVRLGGEVEKMRFSRRPIQCKSRFVSHR